MQKVAEEEEEGGGVAAMMAEQTETFDEEATPLIDRSIAGATSNKAVVTKATAYTNYGYGSPSQLTNVSSSSFLSSNTCSSAVTPRFSNVTDNNIADDENNLPPRVPSMTSTETSNNSNKAATIARSSRMPPPRQSAQSSQRRNGSFNSGNSNSHNNHHRQVTPHYNNFTSRSSRIKTSTTLLILTLGLFLAICTLFQYFVLGPQDSFHLPSDLVDADAKNDGGSTIGDGGQQQQGGGINGGGGGEAKRKHNGNAMFDEFGRYIIEDYDALPPFSDILPVRSIVCCKKYLSLSIQQ
jgi:hypothetical protein